MKLRQLTEADVEFCIHVEQDDTPVVGNAMASGDEKIDKETEAWVFMELAQGNIWAWALVTVTATWNGLHGKDYLGACSYKSEEDFKQSDGYYGDMKIRALEDLNKTLQEFADKIAPLKADCAHKMRKVGDVEWCEHCGAIRYFFFNSRWEWLIPSPDPLDRFPDKGDALLEIP